MNQSEKEFLGAAERAFITFSEQHPEFPALEAYQREMARELVKAGLSPTNPKHLAQVWEKMRRKSPGVSPAPAHSPTPAQPAPKSENDAVEAEARRLIAEGLTLETIEAMSSAKLEMFASSPAGQRAFDILRPPRPAHHRTLGDLAHEQEQREARHKAELQEQEQRLNAEHARTVEQSQGGRFRPGSHNYPNLHQAVSVPKTSAERIAAQRDRQREKDREFVEGATSKASRAQRVKSKPILYR